MSDQPSMQGLRKHCNPFRPLLTGVQALRTKLATFHGGVSCALPLRLNPLKDFIGTQRQMCKRGTTLRDRSRAAVDRSPDTSLAFRQLDRGREFLDTAARPHRLVEVPRVEKWSSWRAAHCVSRGSVLMLAIRDSSHCLSAAEASRFAGGVSHDVDIRIVPDSRDI
jgi:hypothetical protein